MTSAAQRLSGEWNGEGSETRAEKRCEHRLEQWRQAGEVEQVKTNRTDIRHRGGGS